MCQIAGTKGSVFVKIGGLKVVDMSLMDKSPFSLVEKIFVNWTVQVTFNAPTEVDEIWDATPWKQGDGQVWHFTTKGGNFEQTGEFAFNFLAGHWDGWIDGDVVYCTDDDKPGQESSSTQSTRNRSP